MKRDGARDSKVQQTKKGQQWCFVANTHVAVSAESRLTLAVTTTVANVADVAEVDKTLHGKGKPAYADAGYIGAAKRAPKRERRWLVAARHSKVKAIEDEQLRDPAPQIEHLNPSIRAPIEHPFRVINRPFDYQKARFNGLTKNMTQTQMLFALANLSLTPNAGRSRTSRRPLRVSLLRLSLVVAHFVRTIAGRAKRSWSAASTEQLVVSPPVAICDAPLHMLSTITKDQR